MRGVLNLRFVLFLAMALSAANCVMAGQVVSSPRNVNAVTQARGFYLTPAQNAPAGYSPTGVDLAPVQSFEIVRPRGERVKIGRLYTSCTCVQLETSKRDFAQGERALFHLHNVIATPPGGQNYAIYVQITSPIRTTLRYDTYVQSSQFAQQALPEPVEAAVEEIEEEREKTEEPPPAEEEKPEEEAVAAGTEEKEDAPGAAEEPAEEETPKEAE